MQEGNNFSLAVSAFTEGITDGFNPCGLASVMVFIIFLSIVGSTAKRIFLLGALFICVAVGTHFMSVLGAWDQLLTETIVLSYIRSAYILLAITFLIIGIFNALDWWRYKKNPNIRSFRFYLPVFFQEKNVDQLRSCKWNIFRLFGLSLLAVFISFLIVLLSATYPQDEFIFIVHSYWMSGVNKKLAEALFLMYTIGMIIPMIISWIMILWIGIRKSNSERTMVYCKAIAAALFFSTSFGLGYFYLT